MTKRFPPTGTEIPGFASLMIVVDVSTSDAVGGVHVAIADVAPAGADRTIVDGHPVITGGLLSTAEEKKSVNDLRQKPILRTRD